jgi:hypothetical protein
VDRVGRQRAGLAEPGDTGEELAQRGGSDMGRCSLGVVSDGPSAKHLRYASTSNAEMALK